MKKKYCTPKLVKFKSIRKITQASFPSTPNDGGSNPNHSS